MLLLKWDIFTLQAGSGVLLYKSVYIFHLHEMVFIDILITFERFTNCKEKKI